jgi:hypothetical protein
MYALLFILLSTAGPLIDAAPFDSLEECEIARAELVMVLEEHNEKQPDKVQHFAAACAPIEKAPQGKSV